MAEKHHLTIATFGHVGDGNLHACAIMDPMNREEWAELGAEMIVSACPSCKSSLQQATARLRRERKGRLKVMDITEVVADVLA